MGENKISVSRMQSVLKKCNCTLPNEIDVLLNSVTGKAEYKVNEKEKSARYSALSLNNSEDEIRKDYLKMINGFDLDIDYMYMDRSKFNKQVKKIRFEYKKK